MLICSRTVRSLLDWTVQLMRRELQYSKFKSTVGQPAVLQIFQYSISSKYCTVSAKLEYTLLLLNIK